MLISKTVKFNITSAMLTLQVVEINITSVLLTLQIVEINIASALLISERYKYPSVYNDGQKYILGTRFKR